MKLEAKRLFIKVVVAAFLIKSIISKFEKPFQFVC